ncbi:alpha/beta hydrolase [Haloechinothrix halophila]|uniref:alpha/beta hydrolase n=1 Tax=Haloechinothrix halophila TaxID=1069073 RepID=UPI0003FD6075|nr:alpha/beta hydrolase fold domain-containing protein [Haloechinothrix halophila]
MPIHPAFADHLHLLDGLPSFVEIGGDPAALRRLDEFERATTFGEPPTTPTRADAAPGPHGPVPVRVYEPPDTVADRPCLVWMHGGAFISGGLDMPEADWVSRAVATRARAVVVSVDYRLAVNGARYPVPHDDVVAAIRWVRDEAASLKVDPARITIGGASAGGNLAAGAALRLRDTDDWLPAQLLLAYTTVHAIVPPPSLAIAGVDVRQVLARGLLHGFLNHSAEIEPVSRALDVISDVVIGNSRRTTGYVADSAAR